MNTKLKYLIPVFFTIVFGNTINVSTTGSDDTADGTDSNPYFTIQAAIDAADDGDTVLIHPGTYVENINYNGKNIVVGSLFLTTQDTTYISSTVIDGNQNGTVVKISDGSDSSTVLSGFTIQNGTGESELQFEFEGGGVAILNNSSPSINNCIINNNEVYSRGGGIMIRDSNPVISKCTIKNNVSHGDGGGVWINHSDVIIENTIIQSNSGSGGSAISCYNSDLILNQSVISDNDANFSIILIDGYSGGLVSVINSTIVDNKGIYTINAEYADFQIINSIIWNNIGPPIRTAYFSKIDIDYTNITEGYNSITEFDSPSTLTKTLGDNIYKTDPRFSNDENFRFSLSNFSPLIGAGLDTSIVPTTDILGNPRPNPAGSNPDIGAYENARAEPLPHNTKIYVATDGSDESEVGLESAPFRTIQAAVDYSIDGDTILLSDGQYSGEGNYNIELWYRKNTLITSINNSHYVVIDCEKNGRFIGVSYCDSITISGITIMNGYAEGGAIAADKSRGIIINKCIFIDNSHPSSRYGGAIDIDESNGIIVNNTFWGNEGSGNWPGVIVFWSNSSGIVSNNIFWNNWYNPIFRSNAIEDSVSAEYNIYQTESYGGWYYKNSLNLYPEFKDSANLDFSLKWGSPAIDAGDPSILDPDGTRSDIGALYFDQNDTTPPSIAFISESTTSIGTSDTYIMRWEAEDNWVLDSAFIDLYYPGQPLKRIKSLMADEFETTVEIPDSTTDSIRFIITVWDYKHNTGMDTSRAIKVFDNIKPTAAILQPSAETSIKEGDSLTIAWQATDNINLKEAELHLKLDENNTTWISTGTFNPFDSISILLPEYGVTDNAVIRVTVSDSSDNSVSIISEPFRITDNTPPLIASRPFSNNNLEISSRATIPWSASDNVEVVGVDIDYSADNGVTYQNIVQGTSNDGEHEWTVPNTPSTEVIFRIMAYDAVGLRDTTYSDRVAIIIVYPSITSITPDEGFLTWHSEKIELQFSQTMDDESFTLSNFNYGTDRSDDASISHSYDSASSTLTLALAQPLTASDTLYMHLSGERITNLFGYGLDVDKDQLPGPDLDLVYPVAMHADYDTSGTIDALDLVHFVHGWNNQDTYYELGPVVGTPPYLGMRPDSIFDVEDIMGFIMMGNWYLSTSGQAGKLRPLGKTVSVEQHANMLKIELDKDGSASDIQVIYDPEIVQLENLDIDSDIKLAHHDIQNGLLKLSLQHTDLDYIKVPFKFLSRTSESTIGINYRSVAENGTITSQFSKDVQLINLPDKFALHNNYPNPFNPVTTIMYDVPKQEHIKLTVYDLMGREVTSLVDKVESPGYKSVQWNGKNAKFEKVSAGIYFYQLQSKSFNKTRKMVLVK